MGNLIKGGLIVAAGAFVICGIVHLVRANYYGIDGYNGYGYDRNGRDRDGFDREGFDSDGYDRQGFDHLGWDREGYSQFGFDKDGFDRNGRDRKGFDRFGFCPAGIDRGGINRQGAEKIILDVEKLKNRAWVEMKASGFREALANIRTGIDHCVMLILKHRTGRDFDDYDSNMQSRIEKCRYYNVLNDDEVCKLQEARKHSNAIHNLQINKEFNQVYFCFKTLEELIAKSREYLDIRNTDFDVAQLV